MSTTEINTTNATNATRAEFATHNAELKNKIEKIVRECFKKCEAMKFKDLNYAMPRTITPKKHLQQKIDILHNVDEYSQTFLSIHTRAKSTLRDFQANRFDTNAHELLRLIFTLSDEMMYKRLRSVAVREVVEVVKEIKKEVVAKNPEETEIDSQNLATKEIKEIASTENVSQLATEGLKVELVNESKIVLKAKTRIVKEGVSGTELFVKKQRLIKKQIQEQRTVNELLDMVL